MHRSPPAVFWSEIVTLSAPPDRIAAAMVYDPMRAAWVLSSGEDLDDMWMLQWTSTQPDVVVIGASYKSQLPTPWLRKVESEQVA